MVNNTELSFEEVCENLHFMKANPQYLLMHVSYYLNSWWACVEHVMNFIQGEMAESPVDELTDAELSTLKLGFIMLPSIAYMEDNETSYKLYDIICLLMYNFAQITEDEELMSVFDANMTITKSRESIRDLLTIAQSVMVQYQVMNLGNKSSDPYQLSLEYLRALTNQEDCE